MDKDRSNNSIKENFSLIFNILYDEKDKEIDKKYAEGFNLLGTEIFQQNKLQFSENEIAQVGSDFITKWIVKNWGSLNEENRILFLGASVEQFPVKTKWDVNLRKFNVLLCSELITTGFAKDAVWLLGKICQQTKVVKPSKLSKELCEQIRSLLLKSPEISLSQLPLDTNVPGSIEKVAQYGLGAAFYKYKKNRTAGKTAQFQVLKWITESGISLTVPEDIAISIKESEAAEDIDKIKKYLPLFPDKIQWEKADVCTQNKKAHPVEKNDAVEPDDKSLPDNVVRQTERTTQIDAQGQQDIFLQEKEKIATQSEVEKKELFDPNNAMVKMQSILVQLQEYVVENRKVETESKKKVLRIKAENRNLFQELVKLKKKKDCLEDKIINLQNKLDENKTEITELENGLKTERQKLSDLKQKNNDLLSQLKKTKEDCEAKLNGFSRIIEAKSDDKLEVIINRIRESLRTEFDALKKIDNMELTVENASVVRSLLKKIFSKLNQEGIDFSEGN